MEDWKLKIYQECIANGIITDESWKEKMDEKIDTWAVMAMINNMYKKN